MSRTPDGYWKVRIHRSPGDFKLRYRGDGEWVADCMAFGIAQAPSGSHGLLRRGGRAPLAMRSPGCVACRDSTEGMLAPWRRSGRS